MVALILSSETHARDLGVRGQIWEISETDLLVHLHAKAAAFADSGGYDRWQDDAEQRAISYVETPVPVVGITNAVHESTRLFDPSITVRNDILDNVGHVIARAGTRINPLDYLPLSTALLFINGNEPEQVAWALGIELKSKIILTSGPVASLMREHGRPLYFDQKGLITARFAIASVPAIITQEGQSLRIREFPLNGGVIQ